MKAVSEFVVGRYYGSAGRWLAPALALLAASCSSTSYDVKLNSAAKAQAKPAISYRIESNNPAIDTSTLRYQEAENFVKTALSGKGMYEAPKPELADMVIDLDYGIGPPIVTRKAITEPIYQNIPGSSRTEVVQSGTDPKGNPIYSTVTTQEPSRQEYLGDREYMIAVTMYEKHLIVTARENKESVEGKAPKTVWGVQVTSEDESKDLRKYLPVLIAASIEYIGKDSGGEIKTIKVNEKDPAIAFVKKGL
ncbi:MAG TPA: hypothetical protein VG838_18135 [Opitutaceae bacterium]|nr:hypothetical protein [Opitutaceae bacterium]